MHDTDRLILGRITRLYHEHIVPAVVAESIDLETTAWVAPGEPVPFAEALAGAYAPLPVGAPWGAPWATTWMRVDAAPPAGWPAAASVVLEVDLGFTRSAPGFQAEGLVWDAGGRIVRAVEPRGSRVPLTIGPGQSATLYVEAASNPDIGGEWGFRPTPLGDRATAGDEPLYVFRGIRLLRIDDTVSALERDWHTLLDLAGVLDGASTRRARILRALERAADVVDTDDVAETADAARAVLAPVLAAPAVTSAHRVTAVGHAHIDSAWLWPVRETVRKCARTFSNVLALMERYPDFVFAASSAQQYAWMEQHYPELFDRIRDRVREGRWIPVGGMWVESDTNMPGGEALARQFIAGIGFFADRFGVSSTEVWLPDSFGYTAALPQIAVAAGIHRFVTQKTSWNETNGFPHHTFDWEGIDGTRLLAHLPPVDTYGSDLGAVDLARAERQNAEKGLTDRSIVPFGYGDGGGGPTAEMLETALRTRSLEGSPVVELGAPAEFFAAVEAEDVPRATWRGELYLELHRGTYTSQARTKRGNRRCEHLLREAELWAATATVRTGAPYPAAALRGAWETVLLQQFHDILPGSSIAWVHREAEREYARVEQVLESVITDALQRLGEGPDAVFVNAAPVAVAGVSPMASGVPIRAPRTARATEAGFELTTSDLSVVVDRRGEVVSFVSAGREYIPRGDSANRLQVFRDTPNAWDAWDVDAAYQRMPLDLVAVDGAVLVGDEVHVSLRVGGSTVRQVLAIDDAGTALDIRSDVDWHERQKLLKLAFAFDVHAEESRSEIQFGHIARPMHANTSWDMARFEISGHRWVHVADAGAGVAVANDRIYGRDVSRRTRADGGTTTTVRESLLRAPLFPDPTADQGEHTFRHSIVAGDVSAAIAAGYRLNLPLREAGAVSVDTLMRVDGEGVVVEAVKLAEDGSGDVIVRLYESLGRRASAIVVPGFATTGARRVDLQERPIDGDAAQLDLRAFEIVTLRYAREK
ncbi:MULTISPECIES: alpha-mannosidase [Microbacterium]|jgi:alpha-mannosidase|uniref:alpha-mannosidase n=1 Tax=Microbacterium TaxID=33882 RepID=UPI000DB5105A|nr:glycoside hydrolase family 38 C-terminal domain-containing protein [Microbacterium aurum]PZU44271.1 MAG: alpha-mannosidase [Microbacterium sp.]